ncbi:MAG: integration host factor subunit beta [Candidatus Symbiothrix sp.]|jgi:DNA-binding protein HU-beta|nr:integration host factor subunit beta [Candidatus Symbiothrix sp.]
MTKANIVNAIAKETGIDRATVLASVEGFMNQVMEAMNEGENVYLRGFGSFIVKKRAEKAARHIKNNTTIIIPERHVPTFKPSSYFTENMKARLGKKGKKK